MLFAQCKCRKYTKFGREYTKFWLVFHRVIKYTVTYDFLSILHIAGMEIPHILRFFPPYKTL